VCKANKLGDEATAWAGSLNADLGVIVAYGGLVREPLLSLPTHGWVNLHFSDLPKWRGAAPVQRALIAGEQELGVTVFRLVAALDAGAVLTRDFRTFAPGTSAGDALTGLADFGTSAVLAAVEQLAADPAAGAEQQGEPSYAHKLEREDGRLDLSKGAAATLAHWAGVTPEPGAFAMLGDQPVKLTELRPWNDDVPADLLPGEARLVGKRALLGFAAGALEISRVQPAGKAVMDGAAWLRGRDGQAELS